MPKATLFETQLILDTEYVKGKGEEFEKYAYIQPGAVLTMKYTETKNYISEEATSKVTVLSVRTVIDDDWPEVYVLGCVLKPYVPIYVCEFGAYLARDITLSQGTMTIASGHVRTILG